MAKDINSELNELIQLDYNAVTAYQQAIEACDHVEVRGTLGEFKRDHERHISELSSQVTALGGTPSVRAISAQTASFALPFSGAARTLTLSAVPCQPTTPSWRAPGVTRTFRYAKPCSSETGLLL